MVGLAGAPAPTTRVPSLDPLSNVPSGVAVDKPATCSSASAREPRRHLKYTKEGTASHFADIAWPWSTACVSPNGDLYVAMATGPDQGSTGLTAKGPSIFCRAPGKSSSRTGSRSTTRQPLRHESYSGSAGAYGRAASDRPPKGEAKVWVQDPKLTGLDCGYPVGANGIAYYHGDLFVTNTDKGCRADPVLKDGSAGRSKVEDACRGTGIADGRLPHSRDADGLASTCTETST